MEDKGDKEGLDCYWLKLKTILLCLNWYVTMLQTEKISCDWFVMVFMVCFILKLIEAVCTLFLDQYFAQLLMKTRKGLYMIRA